MHSRRSFLATAATAAAASIAGCGILDSGGGSDLAGERWLTKEVARTKLEPDPRPTIGSAVVTAPARGAGVDDLPEQIFDGLIDVRLVNAAQAEAVDRTFGADDPTFLLDVGDFSAAEPASIVPEDATEIETDLDATVHVQEYRGGSRRAFVTGEGIALWCLVSPDEERTVAKLETILAATDGTGESVFDEDPTAELSGFLEDGIYANYENLGTDRPSGFTVAVRGDRIRRRLVEVWPTAESAEGSRLFDEELQSAMEARDYRYPGEEFEPWDSFTFERDGRVVTSEATLPIEHAHGYDFQYPLHVPYR